MSVSIQCGKCKSTHPSVQAVKVCYGTRLSNSQRTTTGGQPMARPVTPAAAVDAFGDPVVSAPVATEKQVAFIAKLRSERGVTTEWIRSSKADASKEIERLLAQPKVQPAKAATTEPEDGIYIIRGEGAFYSEAQVFKVYKMVHGSGRQGVKRLVVGDDHSGSFEYLGLAAKHLPAEAEKMGLEEAKTFGRMYGLCIKCGATLTDESSIANGIGPVCGAKGW